MISALLLLVSSSMAQGPLTLGWSKGQSRYHLESLVDTPRTMLHQGVNSLEARATKQLIIGDFDCTGAPKGKRWQVDCVVQSVSFQGVAIPGDEAALGKILEDYTARLDGKTVQLMVTADGRITSLDLLGVEKTDKRSGIIEDTIRMLMRRLFAPLDVQLPKDGLSKGKPWRQKGAPLAMELLTRFGTAGGSRLEHSVASTSGSLIQIESTGRGSVTPGEALEAGTSSMMKIETTGTGRFDSDAGRFVWREIQTSATFTVSAYSAGMGSVDYSHKGSAALVAADGRVSGPE